MKAKVTKRHYSPLVGKLVSVESLDMSWPNCRDFQDFPRYTQLKHFLNTRAVSKVVIKVLLIFLVHIKLLIST
jgi:hypothetical protein